MYIAELPKDVQTIIEYALECRIWDFGDDLGLTEIGRIDAINTAMRSKIEDIVYLFKECE